MEKKQEKKEDNCVCKKERSSFNLAKSMEENDKLDIPLYLDSSDADYWDEEKYLSEHNYEELVDMESAKTLLNFGDDYRNFIESNNSEVQTPRFIEVLKQKKTSTKMEVNYQSITGFNRDVLYFNIINAVISRIFLYFLYRFGEGRPV